MSTTTSAMSSPLTAEKTAKGPEYVFGTNVPIKDVKAGALFIKQEKLKWIIPFMFAGFGWYCQSVGLHWATYQYVHKYAIDNTTLKASEDYRKLYDSIEPYSAEEINMHIIDMISALIPMSFMVLSFFAAHPLPRICPCFHPNRGRDFHPQLAALLRHNVLRIWTKVMTCAGFLFMCKGALGAMTVVPDSSGWNVCSNRLKAVGTEWMRDEHSFGDMLTVDFVWVFEHHAPLRYCADMMFSGHTFVVTLFSLGTYEMIRAFRLQNIAGKDPSVKARVKMVALIIFSTIVLMEQAVEIYVVERSHFHYSMDVFMAIVITFLIYTNGVIAVFAKHWATWGLLAFVFKEKPEAKPIGDSKKYDEEWCDKEWCDNFVWGVDKYNGSLTTDPADPKWALLNSRGDIFIPPCCIPFCTLAGREHVYSDEGITNILKNFKPNDETISYDPDHVRSYLQYTMTLHDGVSIQDVWAAFKRN